MTDLEDRFRRSLPSASSTRSDNGSSADNASDSSRQWISQRSVPWPTVIYQVFSTAPFTHAAFPHRTVSIQSVSASHHEPLCITSMQTCLQFQPRLWATASLCRNCQFVSQLLVCVATASLCRNCQFVSQTPVCCNCYFGSQMPVCVANVSLCRKSQRVLQVSVCVEPVSSCGNGLFTSQLSVCVATIGLCRNGLLGND